MGENGGQFAVGSGVVESGAAADAALLDAHHHGGGQVGGERGVHATEFPGGDAVVDELLDTAGGDAGIAFVDLAGGGEGVEVGHEPVRCGREGSADRGEVGGDALQGTGGRGHLGFDGFRGAFEEMHGGRADQLFLAAGEGVERGFGASEPCRDGVEREVGEAFGEEQPDQLVEQFGAAGGREGRALLHTGNSTAMLLAVLIVEQYCGREQSTALRTIGGFPVAVDRLLPTDEARDLIRLTRDVADKVLAPIVDEHEKAETYPEGVFATLGEAGLLSLPYPEEWGGGGQPYEVYLQVLEEIAARWAAVAVAVSVHSLACYPLMEFGSAEQQRRWLPEMLGGGTVGAYSLSEPQAGSDAAALTCKATAVEGGYRVDGAKAWITHGGIADFYNVFARTGEGSKGISCFLVPKGTDGLSFGKPEEKMGLHAVPTTSAHYDEAFVPAERRIGAEGQGLQIAFSALDSGRLGIAAVAVGLAQAALDEAVAYAQERTAFGRRIIDHQGLGFLLADMAAAVDSARATYLDAARRRDAGLPYSRQASVAKLVATDAAMKVTTDAVQVLGGYGYTRDFRVERYMREAKITQIFEGTNQIQRLVISRHLAG